MAQTHHYLFDTATGFNDSTGSDNFSNSLGTINASGKINQGFRFEYLTMMPTSTANNLLPTSGAFTIAFWMNENFSGAYLQLFNIGDMNVGLFGKDNELTVAQTGSGSFQLTKSGGSYAHYIISTNGSGTWTVYKNNVSQVLTGTSNWTPNATTYNSTSDFSFNGGGNGDPVLIDDLRIYNEVIDGTERSFIYNSGSGTQSDSGGGGGGSATQLSVLTQPTRSYSTKNIATQPVINLLTSGGTVDGSATNTVFANVVSGAATIGGSTSVSATSGVATFSGLSITGFGPIGLGFTASGLTAAYTNTFLVDIPVPVRPIRSETSGLIPTSGQLQIGELAINIVDQKGYVKKADGTIATVWQAGSSLTSGSVISGYIGNAAVVSGSIASGVIGLSHIASGVIQSGITLTSGSVISGFIGNNAVNSGNISSGSVGLVHLASGTVFSGTFVTSGSVQSGALGNASVVSGSIGSGQVGLFHLASGTVFSGTFVTSGSVQSGSLGNAAVVSGSIGSGQIGTFHLASGVGGGGASLTSGSVTSGFIGNAAVVSGSVGSGQIGTIHFSSGSVTKFTSSASAPSSPSEGDRWYYTTDGVLLTYVNDGSSSQWVQF